MELKVHLFPFGEDSLELIESLIPESKREIISARWSVAFDDPILGEILHAGESTDGFWISSGARLSVSELQELSHFEIVCRKTIHVSDKDHEANRHRYWTKAVFPLFGYPRVSLWRVFSWNPIWLVQLEIRPASTFALFYASHAIIRSMKEGIIGTMLNT